MDLRIFYIFTDIKDVNLKPWSETQTVEWVTMSQRWNIHFPWIWNIVLKLLVQCWSVWNSFRSLSFLFFGLFSCFFDQIHHTRFAQQNHTLYRKKLKKFLQINCNGQTQRKMWNVGEIKFHDKNETRNLFPLVQKVK